MALQANSTDVYRGGVLVVQRVLVENGEPAKALDECHKKIAEIYVRYEKG